jgi:hypothetical protein
VHSDGICAQFAERAVSEPAGAMSGRYGVLETSALGMDRLPTPAELEARGMNPAAFYPFISREWKVLDSWERVGFVEMRVEPIHHLSN